MPDAPPSSKSDRPPPALRRAGHLAVDVSASGPHVPLATAAVTRLVRFALTKHRIRHAIVSVAFVSNRRMASLNRDIMGRPGTTDVIALAFRRRTTREPVIGDIYIAPAVTKANARAAGVPVREEAARVVLHGVLHVLGRDHPDAGRERSPMWRTQERLLREARVEGLW